MYCHNYNCKHIHVAISCFQTIHTYCSDSLLIIPDTMNLIVFLWGNNEYLTHCPLKHPVNWKRSYKVVILLHSQVTQLSGHKHAYQLHSQATAATWICPPVPLSSHRSHVDQMRPCVCVDKPMAWEWSWWVCLWPESGMAGEDDNLLSKCSSYTCTCTCVPK